MINEEDYRDSKNILKLIDLIYYPTQFNFSMGNIPLMNMDYTEILENEFGVIYKKFEEEYYAARNLDSIDFFFNRYHRKIKKLLLDLEDNIYDVICTQIVRPRFHPEIYINNLYKLHEVVFVLCKDFEREFEEVLEDIFIESGFTTKIKYIPFESFKYAHEDFISKYIPDCEFVETGGVKVQITEELIKDFNDRHEDPDESMHLEFALEGIDNIKYKFGPTQTNNPLRTYFEGLLWEYVHGNTSKAEKVLIKKAVHFIRSKIENNNLETGVIALDYLAFFIHTGIGGDNTHGFAIHYFTEKDVNIKELKTLLKVLNDLAICKEYSQYSLSYIKPKAENMKNEIVYFLEERLYELEGVLGNELNGGGKIKPLELNKLSLENFAAIIGRLRVMDIFKNSKEEIGTAFASILLNGMGENAGVDTFIANTGSNNNKQCKYLEEKFMPKFIDSIESLKK